LKVAKFVHRGRCATGLIEGNHVAVVGPWHDTPAHLAPFALPSLIANDARLRIPLEEVSLAAPVGPANKIICVGANYHDHAAEIGMAADGPPQIFMRYADSLVGDGQPIVRPHCSEQLDFEGELAVVIGRPGRHIARDDAMAHVWGYACFMDGSVRDFQRHSIAPGKNFWHSGAFGPWIVSADKEVAGPEARLRTLLNSEVVQSTHLGRMVHGIAEIIAYCSHWTPLAPGDVIATGTPSGIGARRTPPLWLRSGDMITVDIEGVGTLSNPVVDEDALQE
jgi:2-keto-4-pentenoate hydratase/2-oxohepta-3-ene-1,7-dioic acid hydratase in catechol pathway